MPTLNITHGQQSDTVHYLHRVHIVRHNLDQHCSPMETGPTP